MRHLYRCPMRWADLDLLGHVNNVVYVDYLQEARVDLMRAMLAGLLGHRDAGDELAEAVVVVRHEVTYLAPLLLRPRPVHIECWVTQVRAASFTLGYEVFDAADDGAEDGVRRVYLRATTVLSPYVFADERPRRLTADEREALHRYVDDPVGERAPRIPRVDRGAAHRFALPVRFSDVDVYRHVNNVKYFEYLQEARIRMFDELFGGLGPEGAHVVTAQTDVDYLRPIVLRPEPYDVWTEVTRVGSRSMTLVSEVADHDGAGVAARARVTLVFFDPQLGRSTEPPAALLPLLERYR